MDALETIKNEKRTKKSSAHSQAVRLIDHSELAPGLFSLHFDLPGEKVNKFSTAFMTELNALVDTLKDKKEIKCLVLLSDKEGIFIAGADIELIQGIKSADDGYTLAKQAQEVVEKIENLPFPTVAGVNGACLGGGAELALCCKYVVVSDSPSMRIGLPEVNLGVLPGMGGTVRLPLRIGLQAALDYILTGKNMTGEKAMKVGFADALVSANAFDKNVLEFGAKVVQGENPSRRRYRRNLMSMALEATLPGRMVMFTQAKKMVMAKSKGHYPAPLKILEVMQASAGKSKRRALEIEQKAFGELAASSISKRLIELFFSMERVKKLTGVEGFKLSEADKIKSIGLLGAGVMGGGIAQLAVHKGIPVRMKDIDYKGLAVGLQSAQKLFSGLVKKRKLTPKDAELKFAMISPTIDYSGFAKLDLIIEAVVENMDVKKKVLKETESQISEHTLFATNTSSLSVSELATGAKRPQNVVGMHFFNPVHMMPLIEVVRGDQTSDRAVAAVFELSKRMGKTPIVVKDGPGFLVNRLLMPYLNEGSFLMAEGASIEELDAEVVRFGMPMGPATLLDEIGLDVAAKVGKILHQAFGDRAKPCELNEKLLLSKLLGKKSNKGFYIYDAKGKQQSLNPEIYQTLGVTPVPMAEGGKSDWMGRMIFPMINEAAMCLEEKIVDSAEDVDLAMIMGTGFPPFRGGLLRYADSIGISKVVADLERFEKALGLRFKPSQALVARAKQGVGFYK